MSALPEDLERRLRRVEDRIALSDLVADYGRAVDDRDVDRLRELFAADAVVELVAGRPSGREAVIAYYAERMRTFGASFHVPHTQTVAFDGDDEATGVVTAHAELGQDGGTFWVALRYHDRYVREGGRWRFRQRAIRQLYAMPLRELVDGLSAPDRLRWPGRARTTADIPEGLPSWSSWVEDTGGAAQGPGG